ncbi:MAG TPA: hypothetical protein VGN61_00940 [Verrucomicrobiae bacterium]
MKLLYGIFLIGLAVCASAMAENSTQTVETIVCIRHGEKPAAGLGQLTCRGLNQALALPKVLLGKYGTPQFVFAPNPTQKADKGNSYNYIRPLMTIEPTAIRRGLPVNTEFGFREIDGLEKELEKPGYQNAVVFVAWEHGLLDRFVKEMVKSHGGDDTQIPKWPGKDYDSIFLVKITRSGGTQTVSFTIDHEGLDNLSDDCP